MWGNDVAKDVIALVSHTANPSIVARALMWAQIRQDRLSTQSRWKRKIKNRQLGCDNASLVDLDLGVEITSLRVPRFALAPA